MTDDDLAAIIDQYRAGLEAEIILLRRIEGTASRQRAASAAHDLAELHRAADDRDALMAGLVTIDTELHRVRRVLTAEREHAHELPEYADALVLHQQALDLIEEIGRADDESRKALAAAEEARRETVRAVEQGETTLAAYRRVMALPAGATLVNRRG